MLLGTYRVHENAVEIWDLNQLFFRLRFHIYIYMGPQWAAYVAQA